MTRLEELNASLKKASEGAAELYEKLTLEKDPSEDNLKTWRGQMDGYSAEMTALGAQIAEQEKMDAILGAAKSNLARIGQPVQPMTFNNDPAALGLSVKSAASLFVESDAYKTWVARNAPKGRLPEGNSRSGRLPDSDPMPLPSSIKAVITGVSGWTSPGDTSGSALVMPRFRGVVDEGIWQIPLGVADIVTHEPTDSDVIFYVKVSNGTASALTVAEATATGGSSGEKPEGSLTFVQGEAIVRTLAIWIPVTRQAVAASAQLRGVIERYLRYELQRELSRNIIDGSGVGQEFKGIQNLDDVLAQAFSNTRLETARKAITKLLLEGRTMPTAWCMHPTDWEAFDLEQDNEARYYFGGPVSPGVPTLWGVPVRQSEFVALGVPILGDWTRYIVADREDATLRVSDSHDSFFIRNMLALLDELRAAGYCERDEAFCLVSTS